MKKADNKFGEIIRSMRKAAGMSQMRLAERIGVSYQQVQKYEKGASKLNVSRLIQIADVFGVSVMAFLGDEVGGKKVKAAPGMEALSEETAEVVKMYNAIGKGPKDLIMKSLRFFYRNKKKYEGK